MAIDIRLCVAAEHCICVIRIVKFLFGNWIQVDMSCRHLQHRLSGRYHVHNAIYWENIGAVTFSLWEISVYIHNEWDRLTENECIDEKKYNYRNIWGNTYVYWDLPYWEPRSRSKSCLWLLRHFFEFYPTISMVASIETVSSIFIIAIQRFDTATIVWYWYQDMRAKIGRNTNV